MVRILVFGMTENPGGVESFLMNYIREMLSEDLKFDFLCNSYQKVAYEDELKGMGCRMIHFPARSKNYRQYRRALTEFFSGHEKEYQGIWVNVSSLANIDYLIFAKRCGIPRRIIHSHNSQNMDSGLRGLLHYRNRFRIGKYATDFWACSREAALWFYRPDLLGRTRIIHNALSVKSFAFREEGRAEIRRMLSCTDELLIGTVGRLHFQKNQEFLLRIFADVQKELPRTRLVLVGQGEEEERLKAAAEKLGIRERVHFAGVQKNIADWLSAFDLFVFPSVFEGAPVAALEAQANGVPVLASDRALPEACVMNKNCRRLSLKERRETWVRTVCEMAHAERREDAETILGNFREQGYDICREAEKVEKILHR